MYLEEIISTYNERFTFKVIAFVILSLPTFQFNSQIQNILFSLAPQNYKCNYPYSGDNLTIQDQCSTKIKGSTVKCSNWTFSSSPIGKTMISDFNLVCDSKYIGDLIPIVWYVSLLFGPFLGMVSDWFGRKKTLTFCLLLETGSTIGIALSPNVYCEFFFRIFLGISGSGVYIAQVWLMEMVDIGFRPFVGSFFWLYWALSYISFPIISYLSSDWRTTQLLCLIPSVLYLTMLFLPESPRWLGVMDKKLELMQSLTKIFKINRLNMEYTEKDIFVEKSPDPINIFHDLNDIDFVCRTFLGLLCYLSSNLIYTATLFNINLLSENMFLSVFLLGLMELPSLVLSFFSLKYCPRKKEYFLLGSVSSVLFLISIFFNTTILWQAAIRIVLGCIAKVAISTCNQNLLIYVIELLPTTHRSFGFTLIMIMTVISYFGATYINKLFEIIFFLPMLVYGVIIWITSAFVFLWLPETKDLPIPETLTDMKMLKRGKEEVYRYYMNHKTDYMNGTENDLDKISFNKSNESTFLIDPKID